MLKRRSLRPLLFALPIAVLALGTWAFAEFGPPVELPNGWRIAAPPASLQTVGTLPTGILVSRDGAQAYELETGRLKPVLRVLDARTLAVQTTIPLGNGFGVPVSDGGNGVWVANTALYGEQISHVDLQAGRIDRSISLPVPFFPVAIARAPEGARMAVAGDFANAVAIVDARSGALLQEISVGRHPAALAYTADGRTLYVADRAESFVDAIDLVAGKVRARIRVGLHPNALLRDGTHLYVADGDDDDVAVIDVTTGRVVQRARLPFALSGVVGDSPNSLTRDGDRLYVTCGAANAVAVFRVTAAGLTPLGAIATGWYPTALAVESDAHALLIADGKGESGHANLNYRLGSFSGDYVANNIVGAIRRIPIPTDAELRAGLATVESLGAPFARSTPPPNPIVRSGGPIEHVIYIIKENRTYDQVLGDVAGADGSAALVMFGKAVTPNQHALVSRFGVFDRFFCDAHVSADGHTWSNAALANDYLEKMWPPDYDRRRAFYDFEDGAQASVPRNGYLWDDARRNHLTLRDYGEFVTGGAIDEGDNATRPPMSTMEPGLIGRIDPHFAGFNTRIPDVERFAEWKREFDAFEQSRTLPQLEIVRLGRDHTAGTATGQNTPQAMVADNDLAVGKLVEAVSHSADWASTAIFILEDDAQDGPDHVDEQRSTLYIASPYAAGGLQHEHYTTSSVLRTMELILGLPPMTPYDAGARPLFAAFTTTPNLTPFDALSATTDVDAKNKPVAYRAADSNQLDFAHEDRVPDAVLNDILWHAVRGNTPEPPFGAFDSSRHRPTAPDSDDS